MRAAQSDELRGATFVAAESEEDVRALEAVGWKLVYRSLPGTELRLTMRWCGEGEPQFSE